MDIKKESTVPEKLIVQPASPTKPVVDNANAVAANWSIAWISGTDQIVAKNMNTQVQFEGTMDEFNAKLKEYRG